jgi:hypothetical protein
MLGCDNAVEFYRTSAVEYLSGVASHHIWKKEEPRLR